MYDGIKVCTTQLYVAMTLIGRMASSSVWLRYGSNGGGGTQTSALRRSSTMMCSAEVVHDDVRVVPMVAVAIQYSLDGLDGHDACSDANE